jgi:phosphatidylglycerophosphate synthase
LSATASKPSPKPRKKAATRPEPALCLVGAHAGAIFGRSTGERLIRQFARAGLSRQTTQAEAADHDGQIILARADAVIDEPLIGLLLKSPGLVLLSDDTGAVLAINAKSEDAKALLPVLSGKKALPAKWKSAARKPAELDAVFWEKLRKREVPYARLADGKNNATLEWRVFMGTYKGATDIVTKRLWPYPAFRVTRYIAPLGVTPNQVTTIGAIATVAAFFLFMNGHFAWGLFAGWLMTFLDTVDGKLARTTLTSSKWGDVFDHGIDLVHPPFWYYAWGVGLAAAGYNWPPAFFWMIFAAILGGYVLQRLMEGIAIKGLGMEIHIWRRIDTYFREITARRNPNLVILTISLLFGRPDLGLIWVAIWTLACLVLHAIQLAQAFAAKSKSGPLASWMSKRA